MGLPLIKERLSRADCLMWESDQPTKNVTADHEVRDRGHKFSAYRQLPSLREYLLVDVDTRRLELFRLQEAGWVLHEPVAATGLLKLESIGLDLAVRRVFEDLDDAGSDPAPAA